MYENNDCRFPLQLKLISYGSRNVWFCLNLISTWWSILYHFLNSHLTLKCTRLGHYLQVFQSAQHYWPHTNSTTAASKYQKYCCNLQANHRYHPSWSWLYIVVILKFIYDSKHVASSRQFAPKHLHSPETELRSNELWFCKTPVHRLCMVAKEYLQYYCLFGPEHIQCGSWNVLRTVMMAVVSSLKCHHEEDFIIINQVMFSK